ncbi:MAG TPA: RDD family protein [Terriglobales bacterium]|nr:RDD family protein [Terriglobales bacterium]
MTNGAIYCNRCGAQNSALASFCANCGTPFTAAVQSPSAPSVEPAVSPRPQGPAWQAPRASHTPPGPANRYGGFWVRFVAFVIDALVVGIVVWPISAMIALSIGLAGGAVDMPMIGVHLVRGIAGFTLSACANWIYEAALESSSKQATLGKMALGLKVTDLEGNRISFARATGRHFAKILSGMILLIGYIMAGFTERKQALHDMIAATLVVRTQSF